MLLGLFLQFVMFFKVKVKAVKMLKSGTIITRAEEPPGSKSSGEFDPTGVHSMTTVGADVWIRLMFTINLFKQILSYLHLDQ